MARLLTTLNDVYEKVSKLSEDCWDSPIPTQDISFNSIDFMNIGEEEHRVLPHAQNHIALRLGIPMNYLKKCPQDVQSYNLNHWIREERNDNMFIRFKGNDVRAIFTPRYQPVDNKDVLKKLEMMDYAHETEVQCHIDEEFMGLNIPDERKLFELPGRDRMMPGISISNSEVGLSSLSISAFILRLVCSNGLISTTQESASYRHISERVLVEFRNIVKNLSNNIGNQRRGWEISLNTPCKSAEETFKSFNRQFNLRDNEIKAVEWAWPQQSGDSMFNIVNTYTKAAHYPKLPAESAFRLQKTGGAILSLLN